MIDIAAEYGIVLIADEVYQENIFKGKFVSFKKILSELIEQDPQTYKHVQLASYTRHRKVLVENVDNVVDIWN